MIDADSATVPLWLGWYPRSKYLDGTRVLHELPIYYCHYYLFCVEWRSSSAVASTPVCFNQAPVSWAFHCPFRPSWSCVSRQSIIQSHLVHRTDLMLYTVSSVYPIGARTVRGVSLWCCWSLRCSSLFQTDRSIEPSDRLFFITFQE
jgi:hypothetical protein